jgi:hypothetical protein
MRPHALKEAVAREAYLDASSRAVFCLFKSSLKEAVAREAYLDGRLNRHSYMAPIGHMLLKRQLLEKRTWICA